MSRIITIKKFSGQDTFNDKRFKIGQSGELYIHEDGADPHSGYYGKVIRVYASRTWSEVSIHES